ncbi:hypothetical protein DOTSEDRAFT_74146 [Dothistroma septosporum NZE10]|uniref:G-protein coupled receptors family 1 profile domain-containing protein n=1 Tax=Dothistroma septosporum (strain NZE10 / CBS 128990) TaxID=675120 RepID=N1PGL5_DOTSN|nr:hypothetical protein DOTSEDRAFT_74146 [Dothistroma septosporum NZE10]
MDAVAGFIAHEAGNAVRAVLDMTSARTVATPPPAYLSNVHQEIYERSFNYQARASGLGADASFNASSILALNQQYQVQVIASTFSSCSILAALCAIYWFCMMRRNFRRDLVLLLICGDLWKASWFLVFSATTLGYGHIETESAFCQVSGYFLQVGLEACDVAILLMSLHMSLQIFPPKDSFLGHDGLYRIRYYVLAAWFTIPNFMSALAFVNSGSAYVSQGGFCSLPIRPFWYRLALSWVPRYLVWIYVMWVAIRIYRHVGYEFKVFGEVRDGSSSVGNVGASDNNTKPADVAVPIQHTLPSHSDAAAVEKLAGGDEDVAPDDDSLAREMPPGTSTCTVLNPNRRQSAPSWALPFGLTQMDHLAGTSNTAYRSKSDPASRRGSKQIGAGMSAEDFAPPTPRTMDHHHGSVSTMGSVKSTGGHSSWDTTTPALPPITEQQTAASLTQPDSNDAATHALQQRRKAIQRQLRLLFIYPVVYLFLWILPFVAHALNYSNHFAQHPIFALSALNIFCQNIMGLADVTIFCWREKPWRHIPGSDGTFIGSFCFWRYLFGKRWTEQRRKSSAPRNHNLHFHEEKRESRAGLISTIKRWSTSISGSKSSPRPSEASLQTPPTTTSTTTTKTRPSAPAMHRGTHSSGSDRRVMQAEQAQERLALERADWERHRQSFQERRTSVVSATPGEDQLVHTIPVSSPPPPPPLQQRKEWWDRHMSIGDDLREDV